MGLQDRVHRQSLTDHAMRSTNELIENRFRSGEIGEQDELRIDAHLGRQ